MASYMKLPNGINQSDDTNEESFELKDQNNDALTISMIQVLKLFFFQAETMSFMRFIFQSKYSFLIQAKKCPSELFHSMNLIFIAKRKEAHANDNNNYNEHVLKIFANSFVVSSLTFLYSK